MKNLYEFISEALTNESSMKDYDIILDHVDFTDVDLTDYDKVFKLIKEGITETKSRFQVLCVTSVEEYNKKRKEWTENEILKALPEQTNKIVDHMKGLKSVMKRSEAYRQKYINDKLEKFKSEFREKQYKSLKKIVNFDENDAKFLWHKDITSDFINEEFSCDRYSDEEIAKVITDYVVGAFKNDDRGYWQHITALNIAISQDALDDFRGFIRFHVIPMFDEETEKKLDKSVNSFFASMRREYDSGRYMGD